MRALKIGLFFYVFFDVMEFKIYINPLFFIFDLQKHETFKDIKTNNITILLNKKHTLKRNDKKYNVPLCVNSITQHLNIYEIFEMLKFVPLFDINIKVNDNIMLKYDNERSRVPQTKNMLQFEEKCIQFINENKTQDKQKINDDVTRIMEKYNITTIDYEDFVSNVKKLKHNSIDDEHTILSVGYINDDVGDILIIKDGKLVRYFDTL